MSSRDFGFTTLRNVTAYQPNNLYVPPNNVLVTSTNGAAVFSDNISISTLNASTINVGTKNASTINASTVNTGTLNASIISSTTIIHKLNIQAGANDSGGGYMSEFARTASSGTRTVDYQVAGNSSGFLAHWQDARYVYNPANSPDIAQVWGIVTSSIITPSIGPNIGDIRFYNSMYVNRLLEASTINTNVLSSNTINTKYMSTSKHITILDNNLSSIVLDSLGSNLYVDGQKVLTGTSISTVSSLYWSSIGGGAGIFNDTIGIPPYYYQVGIGTNGTPLNATLDVLNTAAEDLNVLNISSFGNNFVIENANSGPYNDMIGYLTNNQDNIFGPSFKLKKSKNFGSTVNGTELGYLDFQGTNTSGTYARGAYILGLQNGEAGATYVPTDLQFITCTSSSGATRMIITNDGKIGIGTTTPSAPLTVDGTIVCGSTNDGVLRLGNQGGDFFIESALSTISGSGNKLHFSNWNNTKTTMVLNTSTQQVGIGTANPLYTLDVSGTLHVSDYISSGSIRSNLISSNNISSGTISLGNLNVDLISSGTIRSNLISSNTISSGTISLGNLNVDLISSGTIRSNLISSNTISSGIGSFGNYLSTNLLSMNSGQVIGLSTINGIAWPPLDDALWSGSIGGNIYNDNSGNVGIGTNAPSHKLTVTKQGNIAEFGSTTAGVLRFATAGGTCFIQSALDASGGSGNMLHFSKYNSNVTTVAIDTSEQRVGINTTTPQYALDVSGVLNLQSGNATDSSVNDLENRSYTYIRLDQAGSSGDFAYLRNIGTPDAMQISLDIHDTNDPSFSVRSVYNNSGTDVISTLMNVDEFGTITANNYTSNSGSVGLAAVGAGATSGIVFIANKVGFLNIIVASDLKVNGKFYAYNYAIYYNGSSSEYTVYSLGPGFTSGDIIVDATNGAAGVTFTITNASGTIQTFNYSFSYTNALSIN
jgi:hypothetical protein